jgi:hypothetical protein
MLDSRELALTELQSSPRRASAVKAAIHLVGSYFRSPGHASSSTTETPSAHHKSDIVRPSSASPTPTPGSSRLRIYNDSLPAFSQPQTPQNLPEFRHQSRLQGAFTAPVRTSSPPIARTSSHSVHRSRRRSPNPVGVQTPGFEGLYGGHENGDDSVLFETAIRLREAEGE